MTSIFRLALSALFFAVHTSAYAIEEGKAAPAFTATLLNGQPFSLASAKGEVVIINFWATWCPPCRQEMPVIESYYAQHKQQGLRVIAISLDEDADDAKVREVMQSYHFDAAFERETQHKGYGRIWRLPITFVIDRKGILRKDGGVGNATVVDLPLLEKLVTPLLDEH
ncbi:thiol-disulfide oxidoreductase ResA [mine drainage metagenome]|uniref:Thiol-disulfide oxidoreductase ResA n=1 Tax=mine drainage metagenome TaxID=410659 RepID=A0A1J5RUI6_9ZZZZ